MSTLQERVERHLVATRGPDTRVVSVAPLSGGACQENFRVDLASGERLVLRSDAPTSLSGSIGRDEEFRAINAAHESGVLTPAARYLGKGVVRDGAVCFFLDWVNGEAIGRKVLKNPELAEARKKLHEDLAREAANIHRLRPEGGPALADASEWPTGRGNIAAKRVRILRESIARLREPRPAQELIALWLSENAPVEDEIVLVHGDYRLGNFMIAPSGLAAVLDWEFAHFGTRYEDLSWISVRDWRFGALDRPVGGFSKRAPFYEAYERASSVMLDPKRLFYWEVLGNLQWAVGCVEQGERYMYGGVDEFELVAIGRRAAEMEFEAIRLLERGKL